MQHQPKTHNPKHPQGPKTSRTNWSTLVPATPTGTKPTVHCPSTTITQWFSFSSTTKKQPKTTQKHRNPPQLTTRQLQPKTTQSSRRPNQRPKNHRAQLPWQRLHTHAPKALTSAQIRLFLLKELPCVVLHHHTPSLEPPDQPPLPPLSTLTVRLGIMNWWGRKCGDEEKKSWSRERLKRGRSASFSLGVFKLSIVLQSTAEGVDPCHLSTLWLSRRFKTNCPEI
jgi:hypothetical protein